MASRLKRSLAMSEGVRPYTAGEQEAAGLPQRLLPLFTACLAATS